MEELDRCCPMDDDERCPRAELGREEDVTCENGFPCSILNTGIRELLGLPLLWKPPAIVALREPSGVVARGDARGEAKLAGSRVDKPGLPAWDTRC